MSAPRSASSSGTLGRITLRMASSLDVEEVLAEITRGLVGDLDAALARIWLIREEEPGVLRLAASAGLSERLDGSRSKVAIGSLKIGQIAETRAPLYTTDLADDPRFIDPAWIAGSGLVAFAGYPLVCRGELLGVLAIFSRRLIAADELDQLALFAAQAAIAIENATLFARVSTLKRKLEAENSYLREEIHEAQAPAIVGESHALARAKNELGRVGPTATTVLLLGETGTGKELFARAVHESSPRSAAPFVKVNCAALTPTLLESELFGHERGAFTGATQRRLGRFELADGGTLFLDEITELPLDAQSKLLRVLQEREIERVGGSTPIPIDVRIVAATNRDIDAEVRAGRFRSDLFFRLNVFPLRLPPLRERRDDIPALVASLLEKIATRGFERRGIDLDAVAYLQAYDWPGNVRELENVLERAAVLARGPTIRVEDLPELAGESKGEVADAPDAVATLKERVSDFERTLIADALARAGGNQSEAARLLRTSRATLQYRMRVLGL
ncbi:MAG: sigma 54-interacting transcriptional regulator [Labilithrix sp.]|nr:sigma 54-interacting transcriptional regulator [Labilithrix sp.]